MEDRQWCSQSPRSEYEGDGEGNLEWEVLKDGEDDCGFEANVFSGLKGLLGAADISDEQ